VVLVATVGGLLVAAGAAVIFLRQPQPASAETQQVVRTPTEQPLPPREPPPPSPAPAATEEQRVALRVSSEPTGAQVLVDGEARGPTPLRLEFAPDELPVTLALKLAGYATVSRKVTAEDEPEVRVKLTPERVNARPPRRPSSPSPPPHLGIKQGR
ncbi:MAG TPA: PEGA domain-containing protein, partial [Myxococcaceae bacterium]|nr:PEGA domain-containing protein [Myxococcaceae bacterium]